MRWEVTGERDLAFSRWHREQCPDDWSLIDVDFLGFCKKCSGPILVIEHARDTGQNHKTFTATRNLALASNIPGLLVLYKMDERGVAYEFRVKQIAPEVQAELVEMDSGRFRRFYGLFRKAHDLHCEGRVA